VLEAERRPEDHLVAVANQALDHLAGLRPLRDELLEGRLDLRAESLLNGEAALVVGLRPAGVVVRADVDPGDFVRRGLLRRAGACDDERDGCRNRQQERGGPELAPGHVLPPRNGADPAQADYTRSTQSRSAWRQ